MQEYIITYDKTGKGKFVSKTMKAKNLTNLRKNIIRSGLLKDNPLIMITTNSERDVGAIRRIVVNGQFIEYLWIVLGKKPSRIKASTGQLSKKIIIVKKE